MSKKSVNSRSKIKNFPMFRTTEQMAKISGIGENTLRLLMEKRELAYIQIGNRRLIADEAVWEWYEKAKIPAIAGTEKEEQEWQYQQGKSKISVIQPGN